jgi:hypothetical protein
MPTYLYECANKECVGEFEEYHSIAIKLETCPHCEQAGRGTQPIERLINGGGSGRGIVELSFDELKAAMPSEVAKLKRELNGNQNKFANFIGESRFHANESERTKR